MRLSVGAVIGNETCVQARPIVRDPNNEPVEDVLRTPAPCPIASFQAGTDDERFAETNPTIRMARFRRWVGVRSEPELDADTRRRIRGEIPDFLARSQTLGNDGELVFLRRGRVTQSPIEPGDVRVPVDRCRVE